MNPKMPDKIRTVLSNHSDTRIKDLIKNSKISLDTISFLFAQHIDNDDFAIQYLAPGLSGAGIVAICSTEESPFIIKYGIEALINSEIENYKKISARIPNYTLPSFKQEGSPYAGYNSLSYKWAGGRNDKISNLKEYITDEKDISILQLTIDHFMTTLFDEWHKIKETKQRPIEQWGWIEDQIPNLEVKIRNWDQEKKKKDELIASLKVPKKWHDKLLNKQFSQGNCHGDFNCRNILINRNGLNIFPILIDFASIKEGMSPAKDWAKFERDVKFRFLRDTEHDPGKFRATLEKLEIACDDLKAVDLSPDFNKALILIDLIRKRYSDKTTNISDAPHLEYLFFLFFTTLAYSTHEEIKDNKEMQNAVLDSAYRIHQKIEQLLDTDPGYKYRGINWPAPTLPSTLPSKPISHIKLKQPKQPLNIPPAYKNWISVRCKKMDIDKLVDTNDQGLISLTLPEIFIPLYAAPPGEKIKQRQEMSEKEQTAADIEDLIAKHEYLLIKGQAGSGKTTLLKHLAYTIANETNEAGFKGFLPVLIFLRDLPLIKMEPGITGTGAAEKILSDYFQAANHGLTLELIKAYCQKKQAIFLIDGMDEIEPDLRKIVVESLATLRKDYNLTKMVLSGRPHGIDTAVNNQFGNKLVEINPLNLNQVKLFIEKWCRFDVELQAKGKTPVSMFGEIKDHPNVEELIITPLMLTAACILYHYDKKLPDQRAALYEKVIDNLISKRFKDKAPVVWKFLMKLAHEVHTTKQRKIDKDFDASKIGFDHVLAIRVMGEVFERGSEETDLQYDLRLRKEFDNIEQNCGLLRLENGQYRFWHLTFQEFLMAREIAMFERNHADVINKKYWDNDWFKEMLELLIGHLSNTANAIAIGIVEDKLKTQDSSPFRNWRLACNCLLDIHPGMRDAKVVKLAQDCLRSIFEKQLEQDPKIWAEAGEILGWLGDPRNLKEFVKIEGAEYELKELGKFKLAPFEISKYPVNNQWYKEFIDAKGYEKPEYWSPNGQAWLKKQQDKFPEYWHERKWKCPNSPVVGVSWYEADAFCRWLNEFSKDGTYRLPTEQEWQAAAAGKEGREYAWGEWQENRCNDSGANIGKTSAVGIFLKGCTPERMADLCGNVWEWTRTKYNTKEMGDDFSMGKDWNEGPVLRGGSWLNEREDARCSNRNYYFPSTRYNFLGFRLSRTL